MMLEELKMGAILITLEVIVVGGNTLIKAAKSRGNVSNLVFLVYSHVFGSLFLAPAAFLFHRKLPAPKLTRVILLKILLFTCFSYVFSLSLYIGLGYASPTLASALSNVSPAYIFILAVFFRMEALDLKAQSSLLKVIGTIVSICGAFIVTFYKGVSIYVYIPSESPHWFQASSLATANWVIRALFLASSYLFHSLEIITTTWVMRDYPSYTLVTLISCIIEAILSTIVALILEDSSTWRLGFDIELWAILYSAILVVGVVSGVHCWAYRKKGPVYVAMFNPLQMIIAIFLGVGFLGDTLHLGSIIGGTTVAIGFYTVMKGKIKEAERHIDGGTSKPEPSLDKVPLLVNQSLDP